MNASALQRFDGLVLILLAAIGAILPFVLGGYEIKLATSIAVQAGAALALGLVVGAGGLVSLGHAAFFGIAAYCLALVSPEYEAANLLTTALAAMACAALAAFVVGAVSIRAQGLYFVLMTLAFGELAFHFFHDTGLAGSADGRYVNVRPALMLPGGGSFSFENAGRFYWLVLGAVACIACIVWQVRRSAFGSLMIAMRDSETRVRAFGFSPYRVRLIAFVMSGALTGLMGYLGAAQHGFVAPQLLSWHMSATFLVMVLIGGKDTVSGPIIGAILFLLLEET
ncbi:MAG: branched-chain amino acid ABC transporter permease, partial [Pseudorhodoplanes sp.]